MGMYRVLSTKESENGPNVSFPKPPHLRNLSEFLVPSTGIGSCQSRLHRAQRNHIACCLWVWVNLTRAARAAGQTIYQLKESLLEDYIRKQLHKPTISVNIA